MDTNSTKDRHRELELDKEAIAAVAKMIDSFGADTLDSHKLCEYSFPEGATLGDLRRVLQRARMSYEEEEKPAVRFNQKHLEQIEAQLRLLEKQMSPRRAPR